MNVKIENVEKNVVQLEIEVDAEKFEEGMQKSFLKNAKKFNIPGFRKGKAPRKFIERTYGEQIFYEDAINIVCPEVYGQAVGDYNLHPVDKPEIDIKQIGEGNNLVFTARITVKPEVELGEYKGVEVEKVEYDVTDEDVDKEIYKAVEKNARLVTVEDRPIQNGDTAIIDFDGSINGEPFEGGKVAGYSLEIGSNQFINGFEEQLIGVNKGDEVEVNITFSGDYGKAELANKPAVFKVKVNEIKFKELPVLDDEFAQDVSEFETLAAYREDVKNKLEEDAGHRAKRQLEDKILEKVVRNAAVEIPKVMIDKQVDNIARDFDCKLRYQGLDLNKYLEISGMDNNKFREQFKERAESDVKAQLVIEKIGQVEIVEVNEEEISQEIKKIAENYKQNEEDFKKHLKDDDIEYIKGDLISKKTVDLLVANVKII